MLTITGYIKHLLTENENTLRPNDGNKYVELPTIVTSFSFNKLKQLLLTAEDTPNVVLYCLLAIWIIYQNKGSIDFTQATAHACHCSQKAENEKNSWKQTCR